MDKMFDFDPEQILDIGQLKLDVFCEKQALETRQCCYACYWNCRWNWVFYPIKTCVDRMRNNYTFPVVTH